MKVLKAIWAWIKKYPWAVIVAVAGVLGAIALLLSRSNQVSSLDDAVQVRAAAREIARKEARAQALEEQGDAKLSEVIALRQEINASKKRVMEIHNAESLDGKSDDDIARLFTAAGF
ncbi:MAG: hypothetical protein ACWGQW_01415 [bacterium]